MDEEMRAGDWMITYTGKRFWPIDPRPEDICIEDIAHSLALTNRFAGHTKFPYSVAEHSYYCSLYVFDSRNQLAALLHDAAEAYIGDMIKPLKRSLVEYRRVDAAITTVIEDKFRFNMSTRAVKSIDNQMLVAEAAQLCNGEKWWEDPKYEKPHFDLNLKEIHWQQAKEDFLDRFNELYKG